MLEPQRVVILFLKDFYRAKIMEQPEDPDQICRKGDGIPVRVTVPIPLYGGSSGEGSSL